MTLLVYCPESLSRSHSVCCFLSYSSLFSIFLYHQVVRWNATSALALRILAARADWKVTRPSIWRNVLPSLTGALGVGLGEVTWTLWGTTAPTKPSVTQQKSFVTSLKILSRTTSAGLVAVLAMAVMRARLWPSASSCWSSPLCWAWH